jgi:hypothetical protein
MLNPLSGEPHEIVGVLPSTFRPIVNPSADVWRPLRLNLGNPSRGSIVLRTVARLADGVSIERAQSDASALARRLEAQHPQFNEKSRLPDRPAARSGDRGHQRRIDGARRIGRRQSPA